MGSAPLGPAARGVISSQPPGLPAEHGHRHHARAALGVCVRMRTGPIQSLTCAERSGEWRDAPWCVSSFHGNADSFLGKGRLQRLCS